MAMSHLLRVARNRAGQLFRGSGYSVDTCRSNTTKTDLRRVEIKNVSTNRRWPNPEAFNALPLSTRTKLYCDYGDEGKMIWKAHADPPRLPVPPFTAETALQKTKAAEAAWNSKDPAKVAGAYSPDTIWRNRDEIFAGRDQVEAFLARKWKKELGYRLKKHLWAFEGNRISARFEYEWQDDAGQWYRTHGNEQWEFDEKGYMRWRDMSGNDIPINENERRLID